MFRQRRELPANVARALFADGDLPSVAGKPGELARWPVDDPQRFLVNCLMHSQRFVNVASRIAIISVEVSLCHSKNV